MVVAKLRGARERKRTITGNKVEGRKSHAEINPDLVALVRQLRRRRPKGGQRSLWEISRELAVRGHLNERGVPFSAASINSRLRQMSQGLPQPLTSIIQLCTDKARPSTIEKRRLRERHCLYRRGAF
jgi:hypothetical protein